MIVKMVEKRSFHRRIFGRYPRRGVSSKSHRKRIKFCLKKKIDKKETTRKVHVRANHCGVRGWRWHVCSKLDLPYYNTEKKWVNDFFLEICCTSTSLQIT